MGSLTVEVMESVTAVEGGQTQGQPQTQTVQVSTNKKEDTLANLNSQLKELLPPLLYQCFTSLQAVLSIKQGDRGSRVHRVTVVRLQRVGRRKNKIPWPTKPEFYI